MIETVIFDIGNVLVDFCWEKHFKSKGLTGQKLEALADATVRSQTWYLFDQGIYTDEEILEMLIQNAPSLEKEIRMIFENLSGTIEPYDYAKNWILELKEKGYKVLLLSNFSEKAFHECKEKMDFVKYADGGILSYREKLIKPNPQIYETLIERYSLVPEKCVFLDDTEKNLKEAEKFGIHTILFTSREKALKELRELGVS